MSFVKYFGHDTDGSPPAACSRYCNIGERPKELVFFQDRKWGVIGTNQLAFLHPVELLRVAQSTAGKSVTMAILSHAQNCPKCLEDLELLQAMQRAS